MRIVGSHSPGGRTVTWSKNSSMPERRSALSRALYATSWNILDAGTWRQAGVITTQQSVIVYFYSTWTSSKLGKSTFLIIWMSITPTPIPIWALCFLKTLLHKDFLLNGFDIYSLPVNMNLKAITPSRNLNLGCWRYSLEDDGFKMEGKLSYSFALFCLLLTSGCSYQFIHKRSWHYLASFSTAC